MKVVRMRTRQMAKSTFFVILIALLLYYWYGQSKVEDIAQANLYIDVSRRKLEVSCLDRNEAVLQGHLGLNLGAASPVSCDSGFLDASDCVLWPDAAYLHVRVHEVPDRDAQCHRITWQSLRQDHEPLDCFNMDGSHWYGGSEFYSQRWPINRQEIPIQQYRSADYLSNKDMHNQHGPILEPYWFNSLGIALFVDETDIPLHIGMNEKDDGRLCLSASSRGTTTRKTRNERHLKLSYVLCQSKNAREIHSVMAEHFLDRPSTLPDLRMLKSPVWSTWARYKVNVNQEDVLQYASEIEKHGFSHSQIEIDDMYTTAYGDLDFNIKKFPNPKQMITDLHDRGFRVTCWVTPFANLDSVAFTEGIGRDYWLKDSTGKVPGLTRWWQGIGGVLDVSNPKAADWYVSRLNNLKHNFGVDSFKFDAGEVQYLPPHMDSVFPFDNPNDYTSHYANIIQRLGPMVEMRSAYKTQKFGLFTRMMDKDSVWGFSNGLQTMIPTALVMSLTGYHYILPDMIGGNGYAEGDFSSTLIPDRELFVRWVQLSAYLPSMQFSFTPWQYDNEVIEISRDMVRVHENRVTPIILEAAKEMMKSGTPIIRPIWWLDPDDQDALASESEFLVGDKILVAPVLMKGATSRDIYLPDGEWTDDLKGTQIRGKIWLKNYRVQLREIPTFTHKL